MYWYSVTEMTFILVAVALVIGWLKGRHDFKDISKPAHNNQRDEILPPFILCCGIPCVCMLVNNKWFYYCHNCCKTSPV
jgi:hypothetical protein